MRWLNKRTKSFGRRFTLVEMLVVIAVMAILISMLLPSLNKTLYRARNTACVNNFKTQGMAFLLYGDDNYDLYPMLGAPRLGYYELNRVHRNQTHRDVIEPMRPYNDGGSMTANNPNFMCPQAVTESIRKRYDYSRNYYGYFFNNTNALGGRGQKPGGGWRVHQCMEAIRQGRNECPDGVCTMATSGGWRAGQNVPADLSLTMRRIGDEWTFKTIWTRYDWEHGVPNMKFRIVATDAVQAIRWPTKYFQTNHIWGDKDHYTISNWNGPVQIRSQWDETTVNLLLDDGSVTTAVTSLRGLFQEGDNGWNCRNPGGAGNESYVVPRFLGTKP
jgi:prepilin-type N-terminal cleavage/methylation domain-containing protein